MTSWPATSPEPDPEETAQQVFTALADPTRRAILAELASTGPATATDLAGRLPITRQAVAKHLALLAEAAWSRPSPASGAGSATGSGRRRCGRRSSSWPRWPATGTARSPR